VCVLIQHGFWFTVAYGVVWGIWSWLGIGRVAKVVMVLGFGFIMAFGVSLRVSVLVPAWFSGWYQCLFVVQHGFGNGFEQLPCFALMPSIGAFRNIRRYPHSENQLQYFINIRVLAVEDITNIVTGVFDAFTDMLKMAWL
jgi:hypothetical protein